jgi:hypothetical protein
VRQVEVVGLRIPHQTTGFAVVALHNTRNVWLRSDRPPGCRELGEDERCGDGRYPN